MEDGTLNQQDALQQSNEILKFIKRLQSFNDNQEIKSIKENHYPENDTLLNDEMCFYKVEQLSFDEEYPRREAFENVLLALDNESYNFVYILTGTKIGIELCIGVVKNRSESSNNLSVNNYGQTIEHLFEGNFSGSKLTRLKGETLRSSIITSADKYKNAGVIVGIPSLNESEGTENLDFQGIDRLINSMLGQEWRLVVVCEPVPKIEFMDIMDDIYELYNKLSLCSKMTMQASTNSGDTISFGSSSSKSRGKGSGYNESDTESSGSSNDSGTKNSGNSKQKGFHNDTTESSSNTVNEGNSLNRGSSNSVTIEIANKRAQEIMKYIDDELLIRMKLGYSKGLYKTSIYYMAENPAQGNRIKVSIMSLFQGNSSTYSPLLAKEINMNMLGTKGINLLRNYQNQSDDFDDTLAVEIPMLYGRPYRNGYLGLNTYLTTKEISLIAGLPQKEVPGLVLKEGVSFGLNERDISEKGAIRLGQMIQKGRVLENIPFYLDSKNLSKHTFIAGVTGSGKTTTCHRLLAESKVPFLVIEPAKTEYRTLINNPSYSDLVVFTLGNETIAPFRLNPFELIEDEILSAHVDMLKATFTSAFPMEASMPQILEEAIYKCYQKKGWNVNTNKNERYGEDAYKSDTDSFPILSDLIEVMKEVVETKGFGNELKANYIGSLVSRLSNLTVGSKGCMLNCPRSIDFFYIANHNVIIEMEELKSPEDKALFMGFILSRLSAVIKKAHKEDKTYKHLTLIEEAHRLLSKVDYGDNGSKKAAVETFTDLLAEVRKYGEGLIIVDQIPNKLAPEVLKNTNTKIIHKILAKDDKEAVGDTMLMDDKQKEFLSALAQGEAVIFTENTDKPVQVKIQPISDTSEAQIENNIVRDRFQEYRNQFGNAYEYLEIEPYYHEYEKLISQFGYMVIDPAQIKKMKDIIRNLAVTYHLPDEGIWMKFAKKREMITGNAVANMETNDIRMNSLREFYQRVMRKEEMIESDFDDYSKYFL